ncbi:MAG: ROK family protein, partial [Victivallales bacterium]|nr:ROK family protein [Victivallales bacterium]
FVDNYVAGIYIAPRFCRGVLIDFYGNIIASSELEYRENADLQTVCRVVESIYHELTAVRIPACGVGICMPGSLNLETGVMEGSINIPALSNVNVRKVFSGFIREPLFLEEESRSIALAEKWFGQGNKYTDFVVVELSFGVGMGIVVNRQLFKGAGQYAGEIGHVIIQPGGPGCRCGNKGCLEAYVSEPAVVALMNKLNGSNFKNLRYFSKAGFGAENYGKVIDEIGFRLGQGLAAVVNILCPRTIILSGTVIDFFGKDILPAVRNAVDRNSIKNNASQTQLLVSELSCVDALGAATLPLADIFEVPGYFSI